MRPTHVVYVARDGSRLMLSRARPHAGELLVECRGALPADPNAPSPATSLTLTSAQALDLAARIVELMTTPR